MTNFIEEGALDSEGLPFVCELTTVRSGAPDVTADSNVRELNYTLSSSFTAEQVNDQHFGVAYAVNGTSGSVHVESIKMEVHYTLGTAEADTLPNKLQDVDDNTLLACSIDKRSGRMVAVGGAGKVLVSSDSGVTWVPKASQAVSILTSVQITNTGYVIVGQGGVLLQSIDLGESWSRIPTPVNNNLYSVKFDLETREIVMVGDGEVYVVSNGFVRGNPSFRVAYGPSAQ